MDIEIEESGGRVVATIRSDDMVLGTGSLLAQLASKSSPTQIVADCSRLPGLSADDARLLAMWNFSAVEAGKELILRINEAALAMLRKRGLDAMLRLEVVESPAPVPSGHEAGLDPDSGPLPEEEARALGERERRARREDATEEPATMGFAGAVLVIERYDHERFRKEFPTCFDQLLVLKRSHKEIDFTRVPDLPEPAMNLTVECYKQAGEPKNIVFRVPPDLSIAFKSMAYGIPLPLQMGSERRQAGEEPLRRRAPEAGRRAIPKPLMSPEDKLPEKVLSGRQLGAFSPGLDLSEIGLGEKKQKKKHADEAAEGIPWFEVPGGSVQFCRPGQITHQAPLTRLSRLGCQFMSAFRPREGETLEIRIVVSEGGRDEVIEFEGKVKWTRDVRSGQSWLFRIEVAFVEPDAISEGKLVEMEGRFTLGR